MSMDMQSANALDLTCDSFCERGLTLRFSGGAERRPLQPVVGRRSEYGRRTSVFADLTRPAIYATAV